MQKDIAIQRAKLTQAVRNFFTKNNFLEVETPIMVPIPGMEPHLTPFETSLTPPSFLQKTVPGDHSTKTDQKIPLYLNTSPELQMKKLIAADFGNIFNIIKVFRNGEIGGPLHNPEFSMIEWYRENASYTDIMTDCENLILELIQINRLTSVPGNRVASPANESQNKNASVNLAQINRSQFTPGSDTESNPKIRQQAQFQTQTQTYSTSITYQSQTIDLTTPWPRLTTNEAFQKYCQIDLLQNQTFETFKKTANQLDYDTNGCDDWDDIFFKIFLNHIEPNLPKDRPVFLYDYPSTQAALAKKSATNPFFAERFELYIAGIELSNAFGELTDAKEQRQRLQEEQELRKKLNKTVFKIDEEFLTALGQIDNPCAGIALGLDRLFMILMDKKSINDVLLFPMEKMLNL